MYFHGGGLVLGGFDTHERLIRELANDSQAAIVFVNYTHSPEAKYLIALEEAYADTKWIAENGQTLYLNSPHLAVAGDSVVGIWQLRLRPYPNNVVGHYWFSAIFLTCHRCQFYRVLY